MTKLLAVAGVLALPACIPGVGLEDSRGDAHDLTVNWSVKNLDGSPAPCPAGYMRMILAVTEASSSSQEYVDMDTCEGQGTWKGPIYTSGRYEYMMEDDANVYVWSYGKDQDVWVWITEPTGQQFAAKSFTRRITLERDTTVDIDIYPDGGFGIGHWYLVSALTGANLTSCAAAGVDTIRYTYRPFDDDTAPLVTDTWGCSDVDPDFPIDADEYEVGSGRTRPLAPNSYTGTLEALRDGVVVGTREEATISLDYAGNSSITISGSSDIEIMDR